MRRNPCRRNNTEQDREKQLLKEAINILHHSEVFETIGYADVRIRNAIRQLKTRLPRLSERRDDDIPDYPAEVYSEIKDAIKILERYQLSIEDTRIELADKLDEWNNWEE